HIAADGAGGAVISWLDQRASAFEVYAQRVGPTGGPQWTADGIPVGTSTSANVPRICATSTGGAIVAWSEFHASYELYAQRLDLGGNKLWGASGAVVCNAPLTQTLGMLSPDGVGGTVLVWDDRRNGNTNRDIYAQRLGPEGTSPTGVGRTPAATALRILPAVPHPSSPR